MLDYSNHWRRIKLRYVFGGLLLLQWLSMAFEFHGRQESHSSLTLLRVLGAGVGCVILLSASSFRCPRCGARFHTHHHGGMYLFRGGGSNQTCRSCHLPKWAKQPPSDGWRPSDGLREI